MLYRVPALVKVAAWVSAFTLIAAALKGVVIGAAANALARVAGGLALKPRASGAGSLALRTVAWATTQKRALNPKPKRISRARGFTTPSKAAIDQPPANYDTEATTLEIVKYPHPALRKPNKKVKVFDGKLKQFAENLFRTMYDANDGIGLAAPQVGVNLRMMVYNPEPQGKAGEAIFVNPVITSRSSNEVGFTEGCLSFPGLSGDVLRPDWIEVEAVDVLGEPFTRRIEGFEARLFQHEYDHLDGKVYIDHLIKQDRKAVQRGLEALVEQYRAAGGEEPAL